MSPDMRQGGPGNWTFPFSQSEYRTRLDCVLAKMAERQAEALLVDQVDSMAYLSGYSHSAVRYQALLINAKGEMTLFIRSSDLETAKRQTWIQDLKTFDDHEDEMDLVGKTLEEIGFRRLALETDSNFLTIQRFERIQRACPHTTLIDFSKVIWEQRLVKSPAEIAYLQRACVIADACIQKGSEAVAVGQSERAPAVAAYRAAIGLGADNGRVAVFGYGSTVANMHGRLGTRIMEDGELYFIEAVPQVHGYSGRIARPIAVGHASERHQRIAGQIIEIQDRQIAAMRPGAVAGDVDRISREAMLQAGLKKTFPQVSGYTLGYHAAPRTADHTRIFMRNETWVIQSGMVFHVILYSEGLPFSETILVTDEGPVRLTHTPRELAIR